MSFDKAVKIVEGWPEDRSAPLKLSKMIEASRGRERSLMRLLVEALTVAAASEEDYKLINKYFN